MASYSKKSDRKEQTSEDSASEDNDDEDERSFVNEDGSSGSDQSGTNSEVDQENFSVVDGVGKEPSRFEALCDFSCDEEGDLEFKKGDILTILTIREDGWWEAVDGKGTKGLVPSTFLKSVTTSIDPLRISTTSGKTDSKWNKLRKAVQKPSTLDVLAAMGALPPGCTKSFLGSLYSDDSNYRLSCALAPKLSSSGLGFRDLFWDPATNQIRVHTVRVQRLVTISSCQNIVELGSSIEVIGRFIYVCLTDGLLVLSNVHVIPVTWDPKSPKLWSPLPQNSSGIPSSLNSTFFIRSSATSSNICILMELCLRFRKLKSQDEGELSCGFAQLPMFDENGRQISNKRINVNIRMGSPFEKFTTDLSPTAAATKGIHPLRAMILKRQKPVVVVKFGGISKSTKNTLDLLPDHLVACLTWLPYLAYYRQVLADTILLYRMPSNSAALMHSPFLACFPSTVDQPDLINLMHVAWTERLKTNRRIKKDPQSVKDAFQKMFLENIYVLWQLDNVPTYKFGNERTLQARREIFEKCLSALKAKESALSVLLSPNYVHRPFDMSEMVLDLQSHDCLVVPPFAK